MRTEIMLAALQATFGQPYTLDFKIEVQRFGVLGLSSMARRFQDEQPAILCSDRSDEEYSQIAGCRSLGS